MVKYLACTLLGFRRASVTIGQRHYVSLADSPSLTITALPEAAADGAAYRIFYYQNRVPLPAAGDTLFDTLQPVLPGIRLSI